MLDMEQKLFKMIFRESREIAPGVRHFVFTREDEQRLHFTPGQFITLHLAKGDKTVRRSYSIASLGDFEPPVAPALTIAQADMIEFAASYVPDGTASDFLFNLQPGDAVSTSGPFGRLVLREDPIARYIFIATGTGVTPYRAMLPELAWRLSERPDLQAMVLLGVQKREQGLYVDDFVAFAKEHPQFKFAICYSREFPATPEAYERQGHVQAQFPVLALNHETDMVYLCGNPNMIDDAFQLLQQAQFPSPSVRREKYISSS